MGWIGHTLEDDSTPPSVESPVDPLESGVGSDWVKMWCKCPPVRDSVVLSL